MTSRLLSPKQLAEAIGASESSVKRWVDDGWIPASRTSGGHRRISASDAIAFVRERGMSLARPDLLGLDEVEEVGRKALERPAERLYALLEAGKSPEARGLVISLYLEGTSLPAIFDGAMRDSLEQLGELWKEREDGVFLEHRATRICMDILARIEQEVLPQAADGPLAIGGAIEGDPSMLGSAMASLVLRAEGFRTIDLGGNTPLSAIRIAAESCNPQLVWMSVNHLHDGDRARRELELKELAEVLASRGISFALGGRSARALAAPGTDTVYLGDRMAELAAFARGLRRGTRLLGS